MVEKDQIMKMLQSIAAMHRHLGSEEEPREFLDSLFESCKHIPPVLDEMHQVLEDAAEKLPVAAERIEDVNRATKFASEEILDALDSMSHSLGRVQKQLPDGSGADLDAVYEDIAVIVNALQFQDISSQKLSHALTILNMMFKHQEALYADFQVLRADSPLTNTINKDHIGEGELADRRKNFEEATKDEIRHGDLTQDEIDTIFEQKS